MSAVRCPLLLKIATFSVKDSAKTLSSNMSASCISAFSVTKIENYFRINSTQCEVLQKSKIAANKPLSNFPTESFSKQLFQGHSML